MRIKFKLESLKRRGHSSTEVYNEDNIKIDLEETGWEIPKEDSA